MVLEPSSVIGLDPKVQDEEETPTGPVLPSTHPHFSSNLLERIVGTEATTN
jgi:hypothetical protein